MAISSRLALWEQKIREEDRSPPPTSPPLPFPIIPGGFIKQLVRQNEKESKALRLKEDVASNSQEDPPGKPVAIKEADLLEVGGDMASSKGQLNGEKAAGEGMVALPEKKTLPFRIGPPRRNAKLFGPDLGPAAPPKAEEKVPLAGGPCPKTSAAEASQGPLDFRLGTAAAQGKRIESLRKETAQGRTKPGSGAKGRGKRKGAEGEELGEKGKQKMEESAEREVDVAEAKKEPGEALAAASWEKGDARKGPEGALQAEVPARGGREQGASGAAAEIKGSLEEAVGEGQEHPAESSHSSKQVSEDIWFETEKIWLVQKDKFTLATELKPDVGTLELPPGTVRARLDTDGSVVEVDEEEVQKANPSSLDYTEDLATLVSLNEASVLHVLHQRFQSQLPYTFSGPHLVALRPLPSTASSSRKAFQGRRDRMSPHLFAVAQRAYWGLLAQRQDQAIVALGRSNTGKTTACQNILEYLVATAGSVDSRVTVEKIQAMFTVLRAFGTVSTGPNRASTRFSMVMALDFSASGHVTAAHLQTMLLERARVAQQPEGEGTFNVFSQMLAGLDLDQRSTLHLHQMAENSCFGIRASLKGEEKRGASDAFAQLQAALGTLGVEAAEQEALWRVLAGIYHLGAAGVCKVGRKQFLKFEWANRAADVLGCEAEELTTAVFKHHLQRILQQVTAGARSEEPLDGPKLSGVECLEGMAAGLYEELFAAVVMMVNRSFSSSQLSMASLMVVDTPGFLSPRHQKRERAATFEEFCHNYGQERLQGLFYKTTLESEVGRYREENIEVPFDLPELSPAATVALVDQNPSQMLLSSEGPQGLLWILDEEALMQSSSDSRALDRLSSAFGKEEQGVLRRCEQPLQFEVAHRLGKDPVRYDATGWVGKAKWNLSVQNAIQLLQQSKIGALRKVFLPRAQVPLLCRSVAGWEGLSQQALQRIGCLRKTFSGSLASVKKRSVCAQIKLQLDALSNLLKRSRIHFLHCLDPGTPQEPQPPTEASEAAPGLAWDVPALRAQLSGSLILEALRLHRIGYADRMELTQFRRHFQGLAQPEMKKFTSAYELTDEKKALEELFRALDLEKKSVALGHTQVFLKAGVLPRLEKQREKLVSQGLVLLQATCRGFLSRQKFRKLKIQSLAARCIQRNLAVYRAVKSWPWWQLICGVRPLLTISLAEGQLRVKEEELAMLQKKLENSDISRQELQESTELLESKVIDLTAELSDERLKGDVACRVLDVERAERLRASKEAQELQVKQLQLQKRLEEAEKQLGETQQQLQLCEIEAKSSGKGHEWQMRLDCAETEAAFLRKRIGQLEERLEREQQSKADVEQKLSQVQQLYEEARRAAQQLKRKCQQLTCELEDTRVLMENQQSRNHELEKKQKKFDLQLAQALGESAFEKSLREKVAQENSGLQFQLGSLRHSLEQKELENEGLGQRVATLSCQVDELSNSASLDAGAPAALQKKLWDLESRTWEQQQELSQQTTAVEQLEQLHLRLELEIERTKQIHQKELEDKEEELEDTRKSCQKRLRQLEMQCEQECDEKQNLLREKRDLEGLVATLCEQIGHRDFDVEKRLRRDLKRTHALLADVQLLLETSGAADPGPSGSQEEWAKLRSQWEESAARCAEAQESQKKLSLEVEDLHSELEKATRNKHLVDEQLYQLQHEKADLLKRFEEDQEDLNELMAKHKALIAQSATDIAQIRELQGQLEELKKEKQALQERLQAAQARLSYLEQAMVERSIVSRQEALICDLESKMEFQSVQIKRFEVLVLRLRDSVIKMGEELEKAKESEARERENVHYYRLRLEEVKAEMSELAQRELEASRRRVDLEKQVDELSAVRQTLQADLETSIRRIADLQVALEEVQSSEESETESLQTAQDSLGARQETESQMSLASSSSLSLNLESEGSVRSWLETGSGWTSPSAPSLAGSSSQLSLDVRSLPSLRANRDPEKSWQPMSWLSAKRKDYGQCGGGPESPSVGSLRWDYGRPKEESDSPPKSEAASPPARRPVACPAAAEEKFPLSPSPSRKLSPLAEDKLSRSSSALSEYVEELRRKRLKDKEPMEEASSLPIYQTTGAPFLRRCRTLKDNEDFQISLDDLEANPGVDLVRSSSLRSISSDCGLRPSLSPVLKGAPRFGSYDSLVQSTGDPYAKVASPILGGDVVGPSRPRRPWRSCLEPSLEESLDFGKEPLMFQSKRLGEIPSEGKDPFSWKIPTLSYERKIDTDLDDFLPAIRKSQSTSSLSRGPKDRKDGQRLLSVHFEDQAALPQRTFLSEMKTVLSPQSKAKEDPGNLSDSSDSSSGSVGSFKSADSIKCRPQVQRQEGEGCVGKGSSEGAKVHPRSEAEGREDDVTSIMMKYLGKE
ncbi:unconventional myosin-XVIIIb-like isoform X3 [Pantherophis guttatus]|uniref:Unconventional myosin-XVIIIb-like isoform X3 n=1 Tax=Pantherophis guttatus TaxID=94885 RepID=A0ABM3YNQ9_PANGU|nr:unconventional myosin-XVIIIb-like isoform X3 [Pantherophis guttatus]